jgi:halogenation protein CepH
VFYEYLMCFYDMHVSENSYFWSAKKVTNSTRSDLESFVELVGGIASGEQAFTATATDADTEVERVARRSREYAQAVNELVANDGTSMLPLYQSSVVQEASLEGAQIQTLAVLGSELEVPLFEGGLIPTEDGLLWTRPA